jgi:hypothetical protein
MLEKSVTLYPLPHTRFSDVTLKMPVYQPICITIRMSTTKNLEFSYTQHMSTSSKKNIHKKEALTFSSRWQAGQRGST